MVIPELKTGAKLELELLNEAGIRIGQTLKSEFQYFADGQDAVITAPIFEGEIFPLHIGTIFYIYFSKREENEIQVYRCKAVVKDREMSQNIHLLRITIQSEPTKVQRRNYYRVDCNVKVQYRLVDSLEASDQENPFKTTLAVNISGGGIRLRMAEKIDIGRLIECVIVTDTSKKVSFYGKVVRYERSEIENRFRYETGIAYIRIDDKDRETVVRYIFEEQRKLRKKGLI